MTSRRRTWLLLCSMLLLLLPVTARAAPPAIDPPPNVASYAIDAHYDPETHRISANQTATYVNRTDTPIPDLVFHLYLNAFRSTETLWMQEAGPGHRGYTYRPEHPGWIEVRGLQLSDGASLTLEPVDDDVTLARAALPAPVAPGDQVTVDLAFEAQLPYVFARTGWAADGDFVMAGQWFPKFGVWEEGAWDAYPFHANSEFYADFGAYDLTLTVPTDWIVGAGGVRQGPPTENGDGTTTHRYHAEPVIDIAWSASPNFRTLTGMTGDNVEVTVYYPDGQQPDAERVLDATLQGLDIYSAWYGPYGRGLYSTLTVIVVPPSAGGAGGMEYPTLFTVGATTVEGMPPCVRLLEVETVHELAHQWFQTMVATNEAEEPWLDEGFTDYSAARAMAAMEDGDAVTCGGWTFSYRDIQRMTYKTLAQTPMAGKAWEFDYAAYGIATYAKPVVALSTLERSAGEEAMVAFLRAYVDAYAFKHPTADDVRAVMAETLGKSRADAFFADLVNDDATLDAKAEVTADGTVHLTREGDLCWPVDVEIATASNVVTRSWPCDGDLTVDDADWRRVVIDPDCTVLLDLNLANNGVRQTVDWRAWLGAFARLTHALQALFRGGWTL